MFEGRKERDNGTWSVMIKLYALEVLGLFRRMQSEGFPLNFPSLISVSFCMYQPGQS